MTAASGSGRIPVTVIGGYLGAGKTTLINRLLADGHGRRLAVLVNDFGALDIDARLITAHKGDTINLANGCVCCTIADALGDALDKVLAMTSAPDQIVIEASGVANPAKIAMYGQGWPGLRLDGIVTVADGESVRTRADDKFVAATVRQQLAAADLLILNKTDLLAEEQQTAVCHWLKKQAPDARLLAASFGDLPAAVLLGQLYSGDGHRDGFAAHDAYRTASFQFSGPFDRERLAARIKAWPAGVLRAKGLVYLDDDPGYAHILQLVGRRYSLEQGPAWNGDTPASRVVVIGTDPNIDPEWLRGSLLSACNTNLQ